MKTMKTISQCAIPVTITVATVGMGVWFVNALQIVAQTLAGV